MVGVEAAPVPVCPEMAEKVVLVMFEEWGMEWLLLGWGKGWCLSVEGVW
jgi:hypothetical protein